MRNEENQGTGNFENQGKIRGHTLRKSEVSKKEAVNGWLIECFLYSLKGPLQKCLIREHI